MLGLTGLPAQIWRAPVNDAVYRGFDPNLVYAAAGGSGAVRVSRDSIDMASPSSVNLATTLLPLMAASVDVTVVDGGDATEPVRVGLWSPWTKSGEFVVFGAVPNDTITAQTIVKGTNGPTLLAGEVSASKELGRFEVSRAYRVSVELDKTARTITTSVTFPDGSTADATADSGLFGNVQVSLNASASPAAGTSHVVLSNYVLTFPHERFWASKVDDPLVTGILILLTLLGLVLLTVTGMTRFRSHELWTGMANFRSRLTPMPGATTLVAVASAVGVYLVGNALLFELGGHPFDMGDEKLYAYVVRNYGFAQLYYLPNIVSLAWTSNGIPFLESAFPYEPGSAYLHGAVGWIGGVLFGGFGPRSVEVEYLTKAINVLFGLADGYLIYAILRQIGTSERWSLVSAALFLFNPAVWFSMSVWGQTHVYSIFFVLSAVLLAEKRHPVAAWLALAAACLTRPQMLVLGLLLGIVLLRKFAWRQNALAISWTVIVVFLALTPFTFATSPSLPVDVMLHNLNVQEGGGNVSSLTTVSQDSYSIWPLVTYVARGASSLQRAFTPSSALLVGPLTYQRVSQVLTLSAVLILAGALIFKKKAVAEAGGYLPFVALGIASFLMLLTGILATHFLLALPFLLLCRRWMGVGAYFYVAAIWTVTTLVPMYGDMGIVMTVQDYPLLARANNHITQFFVDLYSSNRFITVAVVANICAVVWLAVLAFRSPARTAETA